MTTLNTTNISLALRQLGLDSTLPLKRPNASQKALLIQLEALIQNLIGSGSEELHRPI